MPVVFASSAATAAPDLQQHMQADAPQAAVMSPAKTPGSAEAANTPFHFDVSARQMVAWPPNATLQHTRPCAAPPFGYPDSSTAYGLNRTSTPSALCLRRHHDTLQAQLGTSTEAIYAGLEAQGARMVAAIDQGVANLGAVVIASHLDAGVQT